MDNREMSVIYRIRCMMDDEGQEQQNYKLHIVFEDIL